LEEFGKKPLLTLLIDHSGSLRGTAAGTLAATVVQFCDLCLATSLNFEVLGFTTSSWRGGKSHLKWLDSGCPEWPGRLCDLLHVVHKGALESADKLDQSIAEMLLPDYLKENVDGEALLWAKERAVNFGYTSWVCIVLSDGVPVDDNTLARNSYKDIHPILDRHLREVVSDIEKDPRSVLGAWGFIHDREFSLGRFYQNHVQSGPKSDHLASLADFASTLIGKLKQKLND
jgi:cobaltochelatase CobT